MNFINELIIFVSKTYNIVDVWPAVIVSVPKQQL